MPDWEKISHEIYQYCKYKYRSISFSEKEREDISQGSLAILWEKYRDISNEEEILKIGKTVAKRQFVNHLRKREIKRKNIEKLEILSESSQENQEETCIAREMQEDIDRILEILNKEEIELIQLHIGEGLSFKKMEGILKKPEPTIKSQYYKIINKIKEDLLSREKK